MIYDKDNIDLDDSLDLSDDLIEDTCQGLYDDSIADDSHGGTALDRHTDLLKDLSNFDSKLEDVFRHWLGLIWSEEEKRYIPDPDIEPIMNLKCAKQCLIFLKTYARDNNILTDIGNQEFKYIEDDMIDSIMFNIIPRKKEFGIKSNGDAVFIETQLLHWAKLVLMGAGDGKYFERLSKVTTRSEVVNLNNPYNSPMQIPSENTSVSAKERISKSFNWLTGK